MIVRTTFSAIILLFNTVASSQITEDFEDGNLTSDPTWSGNTNLFAVSAGVLNSNNNPDAGGLNTYYISTPSQSAFDAQWEFFVDLRFGTSGVNYVDAYLMSDQSDLTNEGINGYFVRLGDTDDEIVLYKITDGSDKPLVDFGDDQISSSSSNPFRIRVTRDTDDLWTLEYDVGNTGSYAIAGTVTDGSHDYSQYFGFLIEQSSANSAVNGHFFDDITVTGSAPPDTQPPTLSDVEVLSSTQLSLQFSENLEVTSAENTAHYSINNGVSVTSVDFQADASLVILTVSEMINGQDYQLTVTNVEDENGNAITETTFQFSYIVYSTPDVRDITINEFIVDPTPPIGLPEAEFVELLNQTDFFFDFTGFAIKEETANGTITTSDAMSSYTFRPGEYLIVCDLDDVSLFESYGNVLGVDGFPDFNHSNSSVALLDPGEKVIDEIVYTEDIPLDGKTFEQINPEAVCPGESNFEVSTDISGGTPGVQNTVFSAVPDETGPEVAGLVVAEPTQIEITFNERMDDATLIPGAFMLEGNSVSKVNKISDTRFSLILSSDLTSENRITLEYSGIKDCPGNLLQEASSSFYYDITPPQFERVTLRSDHELLITFHEELDETEAERESNYLLDDNEPNRATLVDSARNRVLLDFNCEFQINSAYELEFENLEDTLENVVLQSTMFAYQDELDTVYAIAANLVAVKFGQTPTELSASNAQNYWVEDLGAPAEAVIDESDSALVRLSFDTNLDDNSDLLLYIAGLRSEENNDRMNTPARSFVYDTRAPSVESVEVLAENKLRIYWNEKIETQSATSAGLYGLENDERPDQVEVEGLVCELTFKSDFEIEQEKSLYLTGIKDLYGNAFTTTRREDFVYDPKAPEVLQVLRISDSIVRLTFHEKVLSDSADVLGNYELEGVNPISVQMIGPDSTQVVLAFAEISDLGKASFSFEHIVDRTGNVADSTLSFNTSAPNLTQLIPTTDSTIQIYWSEPMMGMRNVENYSSDKEIIEIDSLSPTVVSILINGHLRPKEYVSIEPVAMMDLEGNIFQSAETSTQFETWFESYQVIDDHTVELTFGTQFQAIPKNNFKMSGQSPQLATLDGADKGVVRLSFNSKISADDSVHLSWRNLYDKYDRRLPDFQIGVIKDESPPNLMAVESDFFGVVNLVFDEDLPQSVSESTNLFWITGVGTPTSAELTGSRTIQLDFEDRLISDQEYQLVIDKLADRSGNFLIKDTSFFTYSPPALPARGDILITEIMADPSPSVGLPEVEYVELFNASDQTINLKALKFVDPSTTIQLGDYKLASDGSVILTSTTSLGQFETNKKLGLSGFPSLGNSTDSLVLITIKDRLVDRVVYSSDWYGDAEKNDGGYSLEMVNPQSQCPPSSNWMASNSANGGTPGSQNSVYSLTPDSIPPEVLSAEVISSDEISVTFSEVMDSLSVLNANFTIDDMSVSDIEVIDRNFQEVLVTLPEALVSGLFYELDISGASDCAGNEMNMEAFSVALAKEPQPGDILITEIMADPSPVVGLPEAEYVELFNSTDFLLSLEHLLWTDGSDTSRFSAPALAPNGYLIMCQGAHENSFLEFGTTSAMTKWISLTNAGDSFVLIKEGGLVMDRVVYQSDWYGDTEKDDGGYSLELIDPESDCFGISNWTASMDEAGGTPGAPNSYFGVLFDMELPAIISYDLMGNTLVALHFSQSMDSLSLVNAGYLIEGNTISNVEVKGEYFDQVVLTFGQSLSEGVICELSVSGPTSCYGLAIEPVVIHFGLGRSPEYHEILITELMPDPEPVVKDLPNSEYIELYNNTDDLLLLESLLLMDGTDTTFLPAQSFNPGAYLILCPTSQVEHFQSYGTTIGLSNWPSLNNSGEQVRLMLGENLIDDVTYVDDWMDEEKSDGGYSLELKDLNNPCGGRLVWGSAISANGGTPGQPNSNAESIPDNFGPELLSAFVKNANTATLTFSEKLEYQAESSIEVTTEPRLAISSVEAIGSSGSEMKVLFASDVEENLEYQVSASSISDCSGNAVLSDPVIMVRPSVADSLQVIINEVLFNPRTDGVDFVEVYNNSEEYIDLQGWFLAREVDGALEQFEVISERPFILKPQAYLAITEDTLALKSQYSNSQNLLEADLPTYPNEEGTVVLLDSSQNIIDRFEYHEDYHSSLLESVDGVSLERIDFNAPTSQSGNWTSASSTVGFATPGYTNSQSFEAPNITGTLKAEPKVFVPGGATAIQGFTTINYRFKESGKFANVVVYDQNGRPVKELVNGASLSTSGFMTWDGTNSAGQSVRMGYYLVVFEVYDGSGKKDVMKETVVVGWR